MSKSKKHSEDLDFDVPTTEADNEALWRAHLDSMKISWDVFAEMVRRDYKPKRTDLNSDTDEPFSL